MRDVPVFASPLCASMDPELWHVERSPRETAIAVETCRKCPEQARCLDFALRAPWVTGVWGGTTQRERALLQRRRQTPLWRQA